MLSYFCFNVFFSEVSGDNSEGVLEVLSRGVSRLLNPNYSDKSTQTLKDPLVWETEKLAFDIVFFTTGKRTNKPSKFYLLYPLN